MVYSDKGPAMRAVFYSAPSLGLPKSPSFHSGLDLMACSHNFEQVKDNQKTDTFDSMIVSKDNAFVEDLPLLSGKDMCK